MTVLNNLDVIIDCHDATELIDTGADYSVLGNELSRRLRKEMTQWDGTQILTSGGHLITPVGGCTVRFVIHGKTRPVNFVVLQDCSKDVILGMEFLCKYKAVIDLGKNLITLSKPSPMPGEPQSTPAVIRVSADHVNLPPRSSILASVMTDNVTRREVLQEGSVELLLGKGVGIARGVAEFNDGRTMTLVMNLRTESQHLTKGTAVGYVEKLWDSTAIAVISKDSSPTQHNRTPPSELDIDQTYPAPQRRQLTAVLAEFSECFASSSKVRQTAVAKHRIGNDENALPVHQSPYRFSVNDREVIQKQVQEMLDEDVI